MVWFVCAEFVRSVARLEVSAGVASVLRQLCRLHLVNALLTHAGLVLRVMPHCLPFVASRCKHVDFFQAGHSNLQKIFRCF